MSNLDSTAIDFSSKSQAELIDTLARINRQRFPENYAACQAEIGKRKAEGTWDEQVAAAKSTEAPVFSRIRRFFAYSIDGILLIMLAAAFFPLGQYVANLGRLSILPFWILIAGYFYLWNSQAGGQTPGKMLLKIRLTTLTGGTLSWKQALARALLMIPITDNRSSFVDLYPRSNVLFALDMIFAAFLLADLLCLLLHPQKRSLIDIFSGTVVSRENKELPEVFTGFEALRWKRYPLILFALVIIAAGNYSYSYLLPPEFKGASANKFFEAVSSETDSEVRTMGGFKNYRAGQPTETGVLVTVVTPIDSPTATAKVASEASKVRAIMADPQFGWTGTNVEILVVAEYFFGLLPLTHKAVNPDLALLNK